MTELQTNFLYLFILLNIGISIKGFWESHRKKNAYGITIPLVFLGMFVWGDAAIFGIFWAIVGAISICAGNWILFLLFCSLFWAVRSTGETLYFFNQQYSTVIRNKPEDMPFYKYFHNDSIWFIYQIVHQCVTVFSIIASLYLAKLWLLN